MEGEALKYVWEGAIPLQIHLHESEVTTLPPPPAALILAPRIGYLPLLVSLIKPYFSATLPPGLDTVWFDYNGLPLKWYIPTGVLFDLLCPEPQRPWNLTVHFRGYPGNLLAPCDGEDSVKWSFINSLKEAAYIINGNSKNVMNMSHADQVELWRSVMHGSLEAYLRVSSKLKLGAIEDEYMIKLNLSSIKPQQGIGETDTPGQLKTGRIPIRLYVWSVSEDFDNLEDVPKIDSWDKISFINRPVEVHTEDGKCFTLEDAIRTLIPETFGMMGGPSPRVKGEGVGVGMSEDDSKQILTESREYMGVELDSSTSTSEIKLVRIQGIEPKMEIPFSWVVNNLVNPDHFLHICVCLKKHPH